MRTAFRAALLAVMCWTIGTGNAAAIPVTWQASGVIDYLYDAAPFGDLDAISIGTSWTLELSFDSDAPVSLSYGIPGTPPTYIYEDVVNARFVLGAYEYTNRGDIYVNADLPVIGASTALGKPGLVQFQMLRGWLGGTGGPDLNVGVVMLASYNDVNAVDGSLPIIPVRSAEQGQLGGLFWTTLGLYPYAEFASSSFNPVPVPEPTSLLLVGSGLALLAVRRRARARREGL